MIKEPTCPGCRRCVSLPTTKALFCRGGTFQRYFQSDNILIKGVIACEDSMTLLVKLLFSQIHFLKTLMTLIVTGFLEIKNKK
jgi:hypothetical protein